MLGSVHEFLHGPNILIVADLVIFSGIFFLISISCDSEGYSAVVGRHCLATISVPASVAKTTLSLG